MPRIFTPTALLTVLFLALSSPSLAKKKPSPLLDSVQSPLTGLYTCADITNSANRLSCFDRIVASLQIKEEKKEIVAIDANIAKQIKRESFGFNIPSLPKLGLPKIGSSEKIDSVALKVDNVRHTGRKYVFTFENGQIWEEVGGHINYIPKGELTATIRPKSMGSFMLSLHKGKTTVRGLRIRRVK